MQNKSGEMQKSQAVMCRNPDRIAWWEHIKHILQAQKKKIPRKQTWRNQRYVSYWRVQRRDDRCNEIRLCVNKEERWQQICRWISERRRRRRESFTDRTRLFFCHVRQLLGDRNEREDIVFPSAFHCLPHIAEWHIIQAYICLVFTKLSCSLFITKYDTWVKEALTWHGKLIFSANSVTLETPSYRSRNWETANNTSSSPILLPSHRLTAIGRSLSCRHTALRQSRTWFHAAQTQTQWWMGGANSTVHDLHGLSV